MQALSQIARYHNSRSRVLKAILVSKYLIHLLLCPIELSGGCFESYIIVLHTHMHDMVGLKLGQVLAPFKEVSIARHVLSMSTQHGEGRGHGLGFEMWMQRRAYIACIMVGSSFVKLVLGRSFMPALRKGAVPA